MGERLNASSARVIEMRILSEIYHLPPKYQLKPQIHASQKLNDYG